MSSWYQNEQTSLTIPPVLSKTPSNLSLKTSVIHCNKIIGHNVGHTKYNQPLYILSVGHIVGHTSKSGYTTWPTLACLTRNKVWKNADNNGRDFQHSDQLFHHKLNSDQLFCHKPNSDQLFCHRPTMSNQILTEYFATDQPCLTKLQPISHQEMPIIIGQTLVRVLHRNSIDLL